LVDDAVPASEFTHPSVPTETRIVPVLDERRRHLRLVPEHRELLERDVAHSEQLHPPLAMKLLHRAPRLTIFRAPAFGGPWTVHIVSGQWIDAEMSDGAHERLAHLEGDGRPLVIGHAVILPARVGEFRLKEQLAPRHAGSGQRSFDARLEVVLSLV